MQYILCIDDDHDFLQFLKTVLQGRINNLSDRADATYNFEFIDDPMMAIKRIEQIRKGEDELAMVISDQTMPSITGIELLKKVSPIAPDAIKVLLTGNADLKSAIQAINNDVLDKYLMKPIKDKEDFVIIIKSLLHVYRMKQKVKKERAERRRVEKIVESQRQQLIQADRMASLGTMAAGVAHEVNNPLNVAIGDIHMLKRDIEDMVKFIEKYAHISLPPDESEKIEKLKKETDLPYLLEHVGNKLSRCRAAMERIQGIVENLRKFSHLDSGEKTDIDINKSIENTLQFIPKKYKQDIEIKTKFIQLPTLPCYGRQLNQVFMNVILNALQSMKGVGALEIEPLLNGDYFDIKISDTGPGIPEDKMERIFEPFYTTKPVGEGTGLGLSISYSIIKKHGGDIKVANNNGKGVTFTIRLLKEGAIKGG